jgi:hypothetical protein
MARIFFGCDLHCLAEGLSSRCLVSARKLELGLLAKRLTEELGAAEASRNAEHLVRESAGFGVQSSPYEENDTRHTCIDEARRIQHPALLVEQLARQSVRLLIAAEED